MNLRLRAVAMHLGASLLIALIAWWLVFRLWYPVPLSVLAGGSGLFTLLLLVDLVLGPTLTAVIANPKKPRRELWRDVSVIFAIQLAALAYGLYTVASARPVALVFEVDMFRLVTANEVQREQLALAEPGFQRLALGGPATIAAVKPSDPAEQLETIDLGLAGIHLAHLPKYWRSYDSQSPMAWANARPLDSQPILGKKYASEIATLATRADVSVAELRVLPLMSRRAEGTVLLGPPNARVIGILVGEMEH